MKPVVELIRLETGQEGTFGVLRINKKILGFVLEPPDKLNKANVSHIPSGQYLCRQWNSSRYGKTYAVMDVPERTGILFHAGNTVQDTAGCLLLGSSIGKLRGDRAVMNSGTTFREFIRLLSDRQAFSLTILEAY